MTDWLNTKIVKDLKPAKPLIARSEKGTIYTQLNDSTYDWENSQPGRAGFGTIHLDPNSSGPWGTYTVNGGSSVSNKEKRLSEDALLDHLWNINNLKFEEEKPLTWEELKKSFSDWAKDRGWIKADGGKVVKGDTGTKVPSALSGRSYWDGFKARNESLWDKVKNNTFVNMVFPVEEVSEGNTAAILPLVVPGSNAAIKAVNTIGKKAVGKTAKEIKQTITPLFEGKPTEFVRSYDGRTLPVYRQMTAGSESSAGVANLPRIPILARRTFYSSLIKKQGGRLMRQSGKIIEVPFENNK